VARIGISITKSTAFRNSTQEFSNVYYYECASLPNVTQADSLIDSLTAVEKGFHSSAVTFVRGRCWSETGNKATNEMISQKNLSGTGTQATLTGMDKERAVLFRVRAGVDVRGNPVYLRKWYHPCGVFQAGVTFDGNILANTTGFSSTQRNTLQAVVEAIKDANGNSFSVSLVAKSGRQRNSGALFEAHQLLEHHQQGDQWRAQ
jgi:hypothetical protein